MKPIVTALLAGSMFSVTPAANAAIAIYLDEPGLVSPDETVQFPDQDPGTTVTGKTNQTGTNVLFRSSETLITPSQGAARIETTENPSSLDNLIFNLDPTQALGFTEFEFELHDVVGSAPTSVTLTYAGVGTCSNCVGNTRTMLLTNGSNWLSGLGTNGDYFTSIAFDTDGAGSNDLRQLRVGGIVRSNTPMVPEPATWAMMLLGFGAIGAGMRRKNTSVARVRVNFA
jgi:hypothetical protein